MEENTNIAVSNLHQWETQGGNKIKKTFNWELRMDFRTGRYEEYSPYLSSCLNLNVQKVMASP
jgi:hypothetical protein